MKQPHSYIQDITKQTITVEGRTYLPEETNHIPYQEVAYFLKEWFNEKEYIEVQTSGSTGIPKKIQVEKTKMINSAVMTCSFLNMQKEESVLLCMSLQYIGAKMIVVRALVAGLNLIIREASGHPLKDIRPTLHLAAMVPLQIYNSLQVSEEKEKLKAIDKILIGGGSIDPIIEKELQTFPNAIYSTYGMTETLSHIALRKLTNPGASFVYTPLPGIQVNLNPEGCLEITARSLCDEKIQTNDLAEIYPDQTFRILGRKDNIINSGGIKIAIEQLEEMYSPYILHPFAVTSVPDKKFGEAITLLVATPHNEMPSFSLSATIPANYKPKHIFSVKEIPLTGNGKTDRVKCKELGVYHLSKEKNGK